MMNDNNSNNHNRLPQHYSYSKYQEEISRVKNRCGEIRAENLWSQNLKMRQQNHNNNEGSLLSTSSAPFHEDSNVEDAETSIMLDDWSVYQEFSLASKRRMRPSLLVSVAEDEELVVVEDSEPPVPEGREEDDPAVDEVGHGLTLTQKEEETIAEESLYTTLETMMETGDMTPQDANRVLTVLLKAPTAPGEEERPCAHGETTGSTGGGGIPRTIISRAASSQLSILSRITMPSLLSVMGGGGPAGMSLMGIDIDQTDPTEDLTRSYREEDRLVVEHTRTFRTTFDEDDTDPSFPKPQGATKGTNMIMTKQGNNNKTKKKKNIIQLLAMFLKAFFATWKQKRKERQQEKTRTAQKQPQQPKMVNSIPRQEEQTHIQTWRNKAANLWNKPIHKTCELSPSEDGDSDGDDNPTILVDERKRQWLEDSPKELWESSSHLSYSSSRNDHDDRPYLLRQQGGQQLMSMCNPSISSLGNSTSNSESTSCNNGGSPCHHHSKPNNSTVGPSQEEEEEEEEEEKDPPSPDGRMMQQQSRRDNNQQQQRPSMERSSGNGRNLLLVQQQQQQQQQQQRHQHERPPLGRGYHQSLQYQGTSMASF